VGVVDANKKRATYQDVLDAPEHLVAEIIDGELRLSPRPAGAHTAAASRLGTVIGGPFDLGNGGPGGWIILDEPELHLAEEIVVPDLAGWRRERLPKVQNDAYFTLAPDWVCEVLSPSTRVHDRAEKLPIYAHAGVGHVWLINPAATTLEIFRRQERDWLLVGIHRGDVRVRAEPFDAIELDLALLWENFAPWGLRANEPRGEYVL
jgi:Uma2 family endonuclease